MNTITYKVSAYETEADFKKKKNATVDTFNSEEKAVKEIEMLKRGGEFFAAIVTSSDKSISKEFIFK